MVHGAGTTASEKVVGQPALRFPRGSAIALAAQVPQGTSFSKRTCFDRQAYGVYAGGISAPNGTSWLTRIRYRAISCANFPLRPKHKHEHGLCLFALPSLALRIMSNTRAATCNVQTAPSSNCDSWRGMYHNKHKRRQRLQHFCKEHQRLHGRQLARPIR